MAAGLPRGADGGAATAAFAAAVIVAAAGVSRFCWFPGGGVMGSTSEVAVLALRLRRQMAREKWMLRMHENQGK